MRLAVLTALTMAAFAANSLLNRAAVSADHADPGSFAVLRVAAGAVMLVLLVALRRRGLPLVSPRRIVGAGALALYMVGFSLAYLSLDAGLGALILFGVVQGVIFAYAALADRIPSLRQWIGAAIAFAGLGLVLWPQGAVPVPPAAALLMAAAGVGWGAYTLAGRGEPDPLAATAANFVWCLPVTAAAVWAAAPDWAMSGTGALLAVVSGAITSGLGYALWYSLVPALGAARSATVQLSVPVIAIAAGVALLGEPLGWTLAIGAALVIGGIALVTTAARG